MISSLYSSTNLRKGFTWKKPATLTNLCVGQPPENSGGTAFFKNKAKKNRPLHPFLIIEKRTLSRIRSCTFSFWTYIFTETLFTAGRGGISFPSISYFESRIPSLLNRAGGSNFVWWQPSMLPGEVRSKACKPSPDEKSGTALTLRALFLTISPKEPKARWTGFRPHTMTQPSIRNVNISIWNGACGCKTGSSAH